MFKRIVALFFLVSFLIFVGIFFEKKLSNKYFSEKYGVIDGQNNTEKIYSVKEVVEILKNNPDFFRGKKIKLKAYVADGVMGIGCEDYMVLIDFDNVELYKKKYDKNLTLMDRIKINNIPIINTGRTLNSKQDILPTVFAVYEGHFYDDWATEKCKKGYQRFVIDKKIEEIIPNNDFANLNQTIDSGCVIVNGKLVMNPLQVTLKNNVIRINNILYEPATKEMIGKITLLTNQQRVKQYNDLVKYLKENKIIIFGGNKYEAGGGYCDEEKIKKINEIIKGNEGVRTKKERLEKILGSPASFAGYDDVLKNWNFDKTLFYHCPTNKETYQVNKIDCKYPFDKKEMCQKEYREWIQKNCSEIIFVD